MQLALQLGNDINAVDKNGETVMHGAAYQSLPKLVKLLADRKADIKVWNRKNKQGWTPLLVAEGVFFANAKKEFPQAAAIIRKALGAQKLTASR